MNYESARDIAISVGQQLLPHTDKLNIAGSIRRKKPEVKDIELIVIAKKQSVSAMSLFDSTPGHTEPIPAFVQAVASLGTVVKGKPDGKYMQIILHEGIALDLFMPDEWDYYRQYVVRTGSADYAAKIIAGGWRKVGWCGSDKGLRLITDCQQRASGGKMSWRCINPDAEKPPHWGSESEFFDWLGVTWIKPELRNV